MRERAGGEGKEVGNRERERELRGEMRFHVTCRVKIRNFALGSIGNEVQNVNEF